MVTQAILIPLLPLISFTMIIFFGKKLGTKSALIAIAASVGSCLLSASVVLPVILNHGTALHASLTWLMINGKPIEFGILVDPLSSVMLFVVTFVGSLIVIYSVGYMHNDPRFSRFFAYLSLFLFSMLGLVLSSTLVQMYFFWELVGLCSYFLIGFWFEKYEAAQAGRKAFITNRIGDVGFFLGIALFFYTTGTIRFIDITPEFMHPYANTAVLTFATILLFCGAIGKSAQVPLHVWLPDAMEGPTPVSALIHAATMVVAGVFMVARLWPVLETFPNASQTIAVVGTTTAFLGAFFAITQFDIKKVLAYSTISQLGFMITALGVGGMGAGTFHLMTHAFFKALLFLGAGSIIHGTGTQDMREMGGLRKAMPNTFWPLCIATIAIAGVPPLSGFWSKDEILTSAYLGNHRVIFWILMITAMMTSFYMFRLLFLTFAGKTRGHIHDHESPAVMTLPLAVLDIGSALIGLPGSPFMGHWFQHFLEPHAAVHMDTFVMIMSVASATIGFIIAFICYFVKTDLPQHLAGQFWMFYDASRNKLWFDEIYNSTFIHAFKWISRISFRFDSNVIDRTVNEIGRKTVLTSRIKRWIDQYIVDGLVNFVGFSAQVSSGLLRMIQTGFVQNYLLFMVVGLLVMLLVAVK